MKVLTFRDADVTVLRVQPEAEQGGFLFRFGFLGRHDGAN
jgi:hypothetical protein